MTAVGGSLETLGLEGREFPVTADAEAQRKIGGFENEVLANGNGSARLIKTRVPLALDGVVIEMDDDRGDQEFVQALTDRFDFFNISLTYSSGITWQASAQVTGEAPASSQSASMAISLMGPGIMTRQL